MNAVLLTHASPFQIACANTLCEAGVIKTVIVEEGTSIAPEWLTLKDLVWRLKGAWKGMRAVPPSNLRCGLGHLTNLLHHRRYYGRQAFHHRRLLRRYQAFDTRLRVVCVNDINGPEAISAMERATPELVFVHGTRLIRRPLRERAGVPFVNLHWGWSPDYRAEGIVSALAREGPHALGVTVHLLDDGIDSGEILSQARPTVDALDNFYSIAVKLTVLGTELFLKVAETYRRDGCLAGTTQTLHPSQLFSGRYLLEHPELYALGWRALKNGHQRR